MSEDERKLRGRLYWSCRKDRQNAHKRAKYFEKTLPERQARLREQEIEAEVYKAHPKEKFNPKSDDERSLFVQAIKRRPCQDCGGTFHTEAMDFDHVLPEFKCFSISRSQKYVSFTRLKEEIAKCNIICANCHRVRTARRRQGLPATLPPPEYHI